MLQHKNAEALSFYPKCVFEREQEKGRLFLGLLNGEPCGYIYAGACKDTVMCHQVCIQYDARRRLYGAQLVIALEDYAISGGAYAVALRCGFDLEANDFWKGLNYNCIDIIDGGIRRNRKINVWRKQLQNELFDDIHITPSVGKVDASIWRKHKSTGLITQFNRGDSQKKYRAMLIEKNDDQTIPH